jgi:DNA repair protein RecN (Recombination protein N)
MLSALAIRDVVLIDRMDLAFEPGLCVLTGETGAGKSILLDSLGLALGARADAGLIRPGAEQASVTAGFEVAAGHPALALLADQEIEAEGGEVLLRRSLTADGRSRAFVNDQPVSVGFLRRLGESLAEIQGQFAQQGLLEPDNHRQLLDDYGRTGTACDATAQCYQVWREAEAAHGRRVRELAESRREEEALRAIHEELEQLDPQAGEESTLESQRKLLLNAGRIGEALSLAMTELAGSEDTASQGCAQEALARALRALEKIAGQAEDRLEDALAGLERAAAEVEEALVSLHDFAADMDLDPAELATLEERYFALKDAGRKFGRSGDDLAALRDELADKLSLLAGGEDDLAELAERAAKARTRYLDAAGALSKLRRKAAKELDKAVAKELPPLKLEKAQFVTNLEALSEEQWSAKGMDQVTFLVATLPGRAPGLLGKIASGGELSRILLALKVCLAQVGGDKSLIFDEVDSGIGGATAQAVGERLECLTRNRQVLVVTHSPQVAARGSQHWRITKSARKGDVLARVEALEPESRREEIARMLAGAKVTDEARAAARRLIEPEPA